MGFIQIYMGLYGGGAAEVVSVTYSRIGTLMGASDKIGTLYGNDHT